MEEDEEPPEKAERIPGAQIGRMATIMRVRVLFQATF